MYNYMHFLGTLNHMIDSLNYVTFGIIIKITACSGTFEYFTWVQSPLQRAVANQIYISVDNWSHITLPAESKLS